MAGELAPKLGLVSAWNGQRYVTGFAAWTAEISAPSLPVRQQFAHTL